MNLAHVFKLINFEWRHPVQNLHVLGTIMVDVGKPEKVRTDPERSFRNQGFRRGLASKSMRLILEKSGKKEVVGNP